MWAYPIEVPPQIWEHSNINFAHSCINIIFTSNLHKSNFMSNAISGVGTIFQRWDDDLFDFVKISEVASIAGPGMNRDIIDVTSLSSVGGYREFIASFRNGGTVTLNMNFTRIEYDRCKSDFEKSDLQFYRFVMPDTDKTVCAFEGLVTELPMTIPADDKITLDVTIQVSGEVVVASDNTIFPYILPFNF